MNPDSPVRPVDVIRMFWHGPAPGWYEHLSIRSFLEHGHRVEVHAYDELALPAGAVLVDARRVLPADRLFSYGKGHGKGSFAAFANLFRYKLLHEQGGTWVDCDLFCQRPFTDLPPACVGRQDARVINNGVLRFPAGHPLTAALFEAAEQLGTKVAFGAAGPSLLTHLLPAHPDVAVLPAHTFYPLHWRDTWRLLLPEQFRYCADAVAGSHAVHWWNEVLRQIGMPKDRLPPPGSWLAEQFRQPDATHWTADQTRNWVANHNATVVAEPLRQLIVGESRPPRLLLDSAEVCLRQNLRGQAADLLAAAHQLQPGNALIRLRLARVLIDLGKHPQAEPHLQAALADPATRELARQLQARLP